MSDPTDPVLRFSSEYSEAMKFAKGKPAPEHAAFQTQIAAHPEDMTLRGAYADWLQDRDLHHDENSLSALRDSTVFPVTTATLPSGKVWAGQEHGIVGIQRHNERVGNFFFSPDTLRFWGTRLTNQVFHGPGGIHFVTSDVMGGSGRRGRVYTVRKYNPETGDVGTARMTDGSDPRTDSLSSAKTLARRLSLTVPTPESK